MRDPRRPDRRHRLLAAALGTLAVASLLLPARPAVAIDEGYDLMRQITSQWIHPNIMLVMDRSGSMSFPVVRSASFQYDDYATDNGVMYMYQSFAYDDGADVHVGAWMISADATFRYSDGGLYDDGEVEFPATGVGQGYWIALDRALDTSFLATVATGSSKTGTIYSSSRQRVYCNTSGLSASELVEITSFTGHPELEGVYRILRRRSNYLELERMGSDGNFPPYRRETATRFVFPTSGNNILQLREVRIGTTAPDAMEAREPAVDGLYDASYSRTLFVESGHDWERGDLIVVSGFNGSYSQHNGGYIIIDDPQRSTANTGYDYFHVARWHADGTWDVGDSQYTFGVGRDQSLTVQRVVLPGRALAEPVWYFARPSRMAITKNVLGRHITIHLPADGLAPTGTDGRDKPYYVFFDGGPRNGAYYDWYHKVWVNWDPVAAATEPIPDPAYTETLEPSDLVDEFSDVINWGLITFNGSCDGQDIRVEVDPDETAQGAVVDAIEEYLDDISTAHGLVPSSSTPTRDGLDRAKEALVEGWVDNGGTSHQSTWDQDVRRGCGRTYGVILMTDGVSNQCNPGNDEWSSCPSDWGSYPAGVSNELWNLSKGGVDVPVRTWVIGVSNEVGRCELNYTAYKGRTDASSPSGDAGFATTDDPRLPGGSPGTYDDSDDYAFFTSSAAGLRQAFVSILASMGVGDYATAAPSVAGGVATSGSVGLLASSAYPGWEGHLRAFDLTKAPGDAGYKLWDAAETLVSTISPNHGLARHLYTWDPANSNTLVEVTAGSAATLDTICGGCGVTAEVVDFVRGNDGVIPDGDTEGSPRTKQLGAIVNSTPAVIAPPIAWQQNLLHEHSSFEGAYADRHTMVWVGTSDGLVRAFDLRDGAEVLALLPPDLVASQVERYANFASDPTNMPLGQSGLPSDHLYGVASSLRFADVYFPGDGEYKTVLFISEGPGGKGLHALDVTHPYPGRTIDGEVVPADADYGYSDGSDDPLKVLWSVSGDGAAGTTVVPGLGETWSVPALGATAANEWALGVGAGVIDNPSNSLSPESFSLDPTTGEPLTGNLDHSSPGLAPRDPFWVSNQAFADAVVWQNDSSRFEPDNLVNEGVQGDLNGRLWRITRQGSQMQASALVTLSQAEPIYYAPAVAGYPSLPPAMSIYAFASGSFYEKSTLINGPQVGTGSNFTPRIHLAVRVLSDGSVSQVAIDLKDLPDPDGGTLGPRTQATAPPMLFTPSRSATAPPFALFLVYDPEATPCVGYSYIVRVNFDPEDLPALLAGNIGDHVEVYVAGQGTAGGFALAGEKVLVAQSAVGEGAEAQLVEVPNLTIPLGGGDQNVSWWVELQ